MEASGYLSPQTTYSCEKSPQYHWVEPTAGPDIFK